MNSSTAATLPLAHTSSKNQRTRASLSCADTACPPRRAAFPQRASIPFYQSMMPPGGVRRTVRRLIHPGAWKGLPRMLGSLLRRVFVLLRRLYEVGLGDASVDLVDL